MSQKLFSISTKISSHDNIKIIRIQQNKNHKSNNNLLNFPKVDNETLFHQNNQLKSQVTTIKDELLVWKNKYQQLQRDTQPGVTFDNNKSILVTLKQQLKKAEQDLADKIKIIDEYKRKSNITKYQELQVELLTYQELVLIQNQEIKNLQQQILDQKDLKIEDIYQIQEKTIQKLFSDNRQLQVDNAKYKTEKYYFDSQLEQLQTQLLIKDKEIRRLLIKLKKTEEDLQNYPVIVKTRQQIYKESVEYAQLQEQFKYLEEKYLIDISQKDQEILKLTQQINDLEEQKKNLEKLQTQSEKRYSFKEQQKLESRQDSSRKLKISLNNSGISQQQFQQQSYSLLRQSSQQQKQMQIDISKVQNQDYTNQIDDFDEIESDTQQQTSKRKQKKIIKVNLYDVVSFGQEIRFKLLSKEVSFRDVEIIFEKYDQNIRIHDLLDILLQEPFKIQSYEHRKLIARYLVEDNNDDYIVYDATRGCDVQIVLSVFKQLIGKYELFSKSEVIKIENELKSIFEKIQYSFSDAIQQMIIKKRHLKPGQCERVDYEQAIKFTEISLTPRQLEYLYFLNYTFFQDLSIIYYQNLMTYFNKSK